VNYFKSKNDIKTLTYPDPDFRYQFSGIEEAYASSEMSWISTKDVHDVVFIFPHHSIALRFIECSGIKNAYYIRYAIVGADNSKTFSLIHDFKMFSYHFDEYRKIYADSSYPAVIWKGICLIKMHAKRIMSKNTRTQGLLCSGKESLYISKPSWSYIKQKRTILNAPLFMYQKGIYFRPWLAVQQCKKQ